MPLTRTLLLTLAVALLLPTTASALTMARVLDEGSAAASMFSSGDLSGSLITLTPAGFDGQTPAELRANFDVILIGCCDGSAINADWTTRLLPYLNLGGGVIWEQLFQANLDDLAPFISATGPVGVFSPPLTVTPVPGLTDGINNSFVNNHIHFDSFDSSLTSFIKDSALRDLGLYGQVGAGRIVLTGPDNFWHGVRNAGGSTGNQYNLALNSVIWVTGAAIPEPSTAVLLCLGLVGLGAKRRRA